VRPYRERQYRACVCVCVCVCVYVCVCVCMWMFRHTHIYLYLYVCVCVFEGIARADTVELISRDSGMVAANALPLSRIRTQRTIKSSRKPKSQS
jgi:hypothetical protein